MVSGPHSLGRDGGRARDSPPGRRSLLFRSENREAAIRRALEIGEGGQSGGEAGGRRLLWVETRLAEVVTLDCPGGELKEEEPLEVHWIRLPATEKLAFEHRFEAAKKVPGNSF